MDYYEEEKYYYKDNAERLNKICKMELKRKENQRAF